MDKEKEDKMDDVKKQLLLRKQQREARQAELQKKALDNKLNKVRNIDSKGISLLTKGISKTSLATMPPKPLISQPPVKIGHSKVKSKVKTTTNGTSAVRQTLTSNLRIVKSNCLFLPGVARRYNSTNCLQDITRAVGIINSNMDLSSITKAKLSEESGTYSVSSNVDVVNNDAGVPKRIWKLPKPSSEFQFKLPKKAVTKSDNASNKQWTLPQPASKFKFVLPNEKQKKKNPSPIDVKLKHTNKEMEKPKLYERNKEDKKVMRRSISSLYRSNFKNGEVSSCIKRSMSVSLALEITDNHLETISEADSNKLIPGRDRTKSFQTPNRDNLFSGPTRDELQNRLEKWLKYRGKSVHSYQHLKCFGICSPYNQKHKENKENKPKRKTLLDLNNSDMKSSLAEPRNKYYQSTPNTLMVEQKKDNSVEHKVAEAVLHDLYRLILEGYPKEQCEAWLHIIKQHYGLLKEFAIYWECKAALQGENGDFYSAVSSYQEAIIKGAEPTGIQKHLDSLLEKFSDLKIDASKLSTANESENSRNLLDKKNIFTSTVIKFAVQQKQAKDFDLSSDLKYIATPVRRSMRISTKTLNTPASGLGVSRSNKTLCYNSLNNVSRDVKKSLVFKTNTALNSPE